MNPVIARARADSLLAAADAELELYLGAPPDAEEVAFREYACAAQAALAAELDASTSEMLDALGRKIDAAFGEPQ